MPPTKHPRSAASVALDSWCSAEQGRVVGLARRLGVGNPSVVAWRKGDYRPSRPDWLREIEVATGGAVRAADWGRAAPVVESPAPPAAVEPAPPAPAPPTPAGLTITLPLDPDDLARLQRLAEARSTPLVEVAATLLRDGLTIESEDTWEATEREIVRAGLQAVAERLSPLAVPAWRSLATKLAVLGLVPVPVPLGPSVVEALKTAVPHVEGVTTPVASR